MRLFISEYVCGGGWPETEITGSLAIEGRAMLLAIADDLSRIADVDVVTTWDARLGAIPFRNARAAIARSNAEEWELFQQYSADCDAAFIIAPELNGVLLARCQAVECAGGRLLGPNSRAVTLCADKLRLAMHLQDSGIPTVPTQHCDLQSAAEQGGIGESAAPSVGTRDHCSSFIANSHWPSSSSKRAAGIDRHATTYPIVIKPRDGAGSQLTRLIHSGGELGNFHREIVDAPHRPEFVSQPFISGKPYSVALMVSPNRREVECFPPAEQRLNGDGRFCYLGGCIPARDIDSDALQQAALAACRTVPGLCGYVGVDLIVPDNEPRLPVVVEINPRLTTSYLGYRALAANNLAEWLLFPARFQRAVQWRAGRVEFDAAGFVTCRADF